MHVRIKRLLLACTAVVVLAGGVLLWFRPLSPEQIARRATGSVVVVRASRGNTEILGTGFAVADSLIATNYHVIRGASGISIQLARGQRFDGARVVTYDPRRDLALLAVPRVSLASLSLAKDDAVTQGSRIFVLGHPEGLEFTLSEGLVSSLRDLGDLKVLQITAPISPGSSGGPVVDRRGHVVGVSTSFLPTGQNLNFAVRVTHLRDLVETGRQGRVTASTADSVPGGWHGSTVYSLEPGVYEVGYRSGRQQSEFALYVDDVGDSMSGRFGPASDYAAPTGGFTARTSGDLPLSIPLRSGWSLDIQQIRSRELFSGDIVFESHGETDSVPFTAVRRRRRLESETTYVLVDKAARSRPTGVAGFLGYHVAGTMVWQDAGPLTVLGSFQPFPAYERVVPAFGSRIYGRAQANDSILLTSAQLSCLLPVADWPNAEGACWTTKEWFGITVAARETELVTRRAWRVMPPGFDGLVSAALTPDGRVQLTFLTQADLRTSMGTSRSEYGAWRVDASSKWERPERVPWPASLPGYRVADGTYEGGGLALLSPDTFVRWSGARWDTIAVPRSLFPPAEGSSSGSPRSRGSLIVRTAQVSVGRYVVLWSVGDCGFLAATAVGHGSGCKTVAASFDDASERWRRLSAPALMDSLPPGFRFLALGNGTVLLQLERTLHQTTYALATDTAVIEVGPPAPDTGGLQPRLLGRITGAGGKVYGILNFCLRGEDECWQKRDLRRAVVAWSPGRSADVIVSDTIGSLYQAQVFATSRGRIAIVTRDTLRFVDQWDSPLVTRRRDRLFGHVHAVLEDTLARRIHLVTSLGEVVSLRSPAPSVRDRYEGGVSGFWAKIRRFFGHSN